MLELLSTSPPLTNSASLLTALRLAHELYRDRSAAAQTVPILTDRGHGVTIRAWRDPGTNETVLEITDQMGREVSHDPR